MKFGHTLILIGLINVLIFSCKSNYSADCPARDLQSLNFGFETNLNEWEALGGKIEIPDLVNFDMSTDIAFSGLRSAKFTVTPDSYVNSGVRSELSFDQQIEEEDETFYEYSIFIPDNYIDVDSVKASDGTPNWQVMGQWHEQPDKCIGQTWDDISGNSPPIALYYNYLSTTDNVYSNLLKDPNFLTIYGLDPNWNNVSTFSLVYGGKTIAIAKINKGEWLRVKFHIKWSRSDVGFIQAWINNANFTNGKVSGKNMLNNASHYFKFGLYRNPTIPFTNSIYYDDLVIF